MTILASRASYLPDVNRDVVLRPLGIGAVTGTRTEASFVPLATIRSGGVIEAVVHCSRLVGDDNEFWIDLVTGTSPWSAEDQTVLVRKKISDVGQSVVAFDSALVPDHHTVFAVRLIILGAGEAPECDYACWLVGARAG